MHENLEDLRDKLFSYDLLKGLDEIAANPTVILLIALLIELCLPIPNKLRLNSLIPFFYSLQKRVNKPEYSRSQIILSSVLLPLLIILTALLSLTILQYFLEYDLLLDLIILPFLLNSRHPLLLSKICAQKLLAGNKDEVRHILSKHMYRQCQTLSQMGLCKALCEHCLMYLFINWWSVAIWYIIAGLPGATLMSLVSVLSRSFSIKRTATALFGIKTYLFCELLLSIPTFIFAIAMSFTYQGVKKLKLSIYEARTYPEFIPGLILAISGSSTDIALGGPRIYNDIKQRIKILGGTQAPSEESACKITLKIRNTLLFIVFLLTLTSVFFIKADNTI